MPDRSSESSLIAFSFRLFWMFIGNAGLFLLALGVFYKSKTSPLGYSIAYWVLVAAILIARFVDIRYFHGETSDGEPATMLHLRRYVINLAIVAIPLFFIAFFLGRVVQ
jgi:hypothetical protein